MSLAKKLMVYTDRPLYGDELKAALVKRDRKQWFDVILFTVFPRFPKSSRSFVTPKPTVFSRRDGFQMRPLHANARLVNASEVWYNI